MVIAVDFDGTIVEHEYPAIGEERPYATEVLRNLIADRHKLILWTMRDGDLLKEAVDWCKERGVEFYSINSDSSAMFGEDRNPELSCKLNADYFIDDRNIGGLPTWTEIYDIITYGKSYAQILRHRFKQEINIPAEPPTPAWMFWKKKKK